MAALEGSWRLKPRSDVTRRKRGDRRTSPGPTGVGGWVALLWMDGDTSRTLFPKLLGVHADKSRFNVDLKSVCALIVSQHVHKVVIK